jgi:hypothetical protein
MVVNSDDNTNSMNDNDERPLLSNDEIQLSSHELFERKLEEELRKQGIEDSNQMEDEQSSTCTNPIESRNWKDRSDAYDNLIKLFSSATSDDCFIDNERYLIQCIAEKNTAALEKGLQVILSFISSFKYASRTAEELIPKAIKLYSSIKPSTSKLVNDILLMYIEIDAGKVVIVSVLLIFINSNCNKLTHLYDQLGAIYS